MADPRTYAVSGASGLIGGALVRALEADGHHVRRLVRRAPARASDIPWNPALGELDPRALAGVDAVVSLAGAGIGSRPWTKGYRRTILESRTRGTAMLAHACVRAGVPTLVSGSGIHLYGDTGEVLVDESAPKGSGFLSDVVEAWEHAAHEAEEGGVRVSYARTSLVVSTGGNAFGRLPPLVRLGLGGRLGSGRQWWSLISLEDEVRALRLLADDPRARGPVNLAATDVRMGELVAALARAYHRPALLSVPAPVLRAVAGEMSTVLLDSIRVRSARLAELGFAFHQPDLDSLVATLRH